MLAQQLLATLCRTIGNASSSLAAFLDESAASLAGLNRAVDSAIRSHGGATPMQRRPSVPTHAATSVGTATAPLAGPAPPQWGAVYRGGGAAGVSHNQTGWPLAAGAAAGAGAGAGAPAVSGKGAAVTVPGVVQRLPHAADASVATVQMGASPPFIRPTAAGSRPATYHAASGRR
jgi:hypothetical protein